MVPGGGGGGGWIVKLILILTKGQLQLSLKSNQSFEHDHVRLGKVLLTNFTTEMIEYHSSLASSSSKGKCCFIYLFS